VVIKRGTTVEFGGDVLWRNLPKDEYLKYSNFFDFPPGLVLLDSPEGRQIDEDCRRAKQLEAEKAKAAKDAIRAAGDKWYQKPVGIVVLSVVGVVLGALALGFLAHYIPQWIH